ncbi:hypothetical protein IQ255_21625 [Pleurocapsales cyanobacterium LEGE 10410]|nr:hypothetical protein [Pleurocapsales cyanobacterium LEGE 10410]
MTQRSSIRAILRFNLQTVFQERKISSHYARLNVIRKITEFLAIAMSQEALTQIK